MIQLWWATLFTKFFLVSFVPLTADENYYWVWSQNLALSYFDHPPLVAWLFKLGDGLPFFMIKWPAVVMAHGSFMIWYLFLKNIGFSENESRRWFWLALLAPLVGMASLVLTPDLPVLFFYSLAVYSFERALNTQKASQYILFGLSVGLGFTAKYHIILILPCLLIYLFASPNRLQKVRWFWVGFSLIFMVLGALPVLWWNYQHDWVSFRFQLNHGLKKSDWKPFWPIDYLLTILLFIFPIYWSTFAQSIREAREKLLLALSVPILLFFLFSSFRAKVEGNWSQLAFMPILSLLAYYDRTKWKLKVVSLFWGISLATLIFFWRSPRFPHCPEKLCEPYRYSQVIEIEKQYQPFFASNYQMASFLWFQTRRPVYKLYDMSRTDFYDTLEASKPTTNEFYLATHKDTALPGWIQEKGYQFETVKSIDEELVLMRFYR